jgi:hypothetical protein
MSKFTRFFAAGVACGVAATSAVTLAFGTGTAGAESAKMVPLSSFLRRCDWSVAQYTPSATTGTAYALISRSGSTVTAEVHAAGVRPDIWYGVRLVLVPRTGISCNASDPGVGMGRLYTDGRGIGTTTVSAPVMSGADGAWVSLEGPLGNMSHLSGDFRTSDYVAPI